MGRSRRGSSDRLGGCITGGAGVLWLRALHVSSQTESTSAENSCCIFLHHKKAKQMSRQSNFVKAVDRIEDVSSCLLWLSSCIEQRLEARRIRNSMVPMPISIHYYDSAPLT